MTGLDPAPIRGRWTIWACVNGRCPATIKPGRCRCFVVTRSGLNKYTERVAVEVVPVPDEAAIERGAKALREALGMRTLAPDVALAVLRAALEPTDP